MKIIGTSLTLLLCPLLIACASGVGPTGKLVGATCSADVDCSDICAQNEPQFPNGLCTVPCVSDSDCPPGSTCNTNGRYCGVTCQTDADCAGRSDWTCQVVDHFYNGAPAGWGPPSHDIKICAEPAPAE
jgi:hypothetical protein